MKKIFITFVNIILIILVLFSIDFLTYRSEVKNFNQNFYTFTQKADISSFINSYKAGYSIQSVQKYKQHLKRTNYDGFRNIHINNHLSKPPILIFGCSFTFGSALNDNQIFPYKLSTTSNRPVLNFSKAATGPAHMLFLIQNNFVFRMVDEKNIPEYAIWLYIPSHISRLYTDIFPHPLMINGYNIRYKLKDDKLELVQKNLPDFFFMSFIVKRIFANLDNKNRELAKTKEYQEKNFNLFNKIFLDSKKMLQERYPNIRFVIINYNLNYDDSKTNEDPYMWKRLEEEGFIIINTKDLIGREYTKEDTTYDKFHPSENVWNELVPLIVNKLNL